MRYQRHSEGVPLHMVLRVTESTQRKSSRTGAGHGRETWNHVGSSSGVAATRALELLGAAIPLDQLELRHERGTLLLLSQPDP